MCSPAAAPSTQTSTVDLPDWAKPYAKETLAKTSALTDINQNPYQKFGGDRIAGFQPMQQQAFESAANMGVSPGTRAGAAMAGTAGLSALNTQYNPMMAGSRNFNNRSAQQYMNPYQQNVTDIAKREAGRQSDIMGTQQAGQATQAGAFGGSRFGIQQAERERNLSQQMGDIQAQGSNTAYNNAQQQFNADQARQMQAQSANINQQQYGANLGMQGLSTGLQAANTLGQLGQNEYGQQMGITQMQGQMGQQQQQQAQRPLDMAYQDFQNQQNYPYKQLGFMSDMVNKLPLGQKSTAQLYEAPGSTIGQIAGLGVGLGGMANFGSKVMAEGGLAYAEGGDINSPQNIEAILARLSDAQLQQAHEAALNRRDVNEAQMIEAVIAQRAAMRQGTEQMPQGIAPALPEQFADGMEQSMATGGIVAFADGDAVSDKDKKTSRFSQTGLASFLNLLSPPDAQRQFSEQQNKYKELIEAHQNQPEFFESVSPEKLKESQKRIDEAANKLTKTKTEAKPSAPAPTAAPSAAPASDVPPIKPAQEKQAAPAKSLDRQYAEVKSGPKPSTAQVKSAVEQLAEQQGLSPDSTKGVQKTTQEIRKELGTENQPIIDEMKKMVESQKVDVEAMRSQGLNQALAEFGFKMAANASRPGARFLESASSAAPALAAASAKTQELITAAQQNYAKLRMDQAKYETALQKNDMQTAAIQAGQIAQGQQQDKLLKFHIADAKDKMALEEKKLASQNSFQQASLSRHETISSLTREIMQNEGLPYGQALEKAGRLVRPTGYAADVRADASTKIALAKELDAVEKNFPPMMRSGGSKFAQDNQRAYEAAIKGVYSAYSASPTGAAGNAQPLAGAQRIKLNQNGDPIQ